VKAAMRGRDVSLKYVKLPEAEAVGDAPSLSLHLLVEGERGSLLGLLERVLPRVSEVRAVVVGQEGAVVASLLSSAQLPLGHDVQEVSAASHPWFYVDDVAETYQVGRPLDGEVFMGPFTGGPLLADRAGLRNMSWESSCAWRLALGAREMIADPSALLPLLTVLDRMGVDLARIHHHVMDHEGRRTMASIRGLLGREVDDVFWEGGALEDLRLSGRTSEVLLDDVLEVVESPLDPGGDPGSRFKVLYHEARRCGWDVPLRHLALLVKESRGRMPLGWVRGSLVPAYVQKSLDAEEKAWVLFLLGEAEEGADEHAAACKTYDEALALYPSAGAAFALCRVAFFRGSWDQCAAAYQLGLANLKQVQTLEWDIAEVDRVKVLVAQALSQLGRLDEAREVAHLALAAFPRSQGLRLFVEKLG